MTNQEILLKAAEIIREKNKHEFVQGGVVVAMWLEDFATTHHEKDFGTAWNKRMDELGATRGTIEDLKNI